MFTQERRYQHVSTINGRAHILILTRTTRQAQAPSWASLMLISSGVGGSLWPNQCPLYELRATTQRFLSEALLIKNDSIIIRLSFTTLSAFECSTLLALLVFIIYSNSGGKFLRIATLQISTQSHFRMRGIAVD